MFGAQTERVQIIKCCEVNCMIISILYGGDINYWAMPLNFCTPEVEEQRNSSGVRVKIVEFFRGKVGKNRNSSGAKPIFCSEFLTANRDCMRFLRGYHIISKIL